MQSLVHQKHGYFVVEMAETPVQLSIQMPIREIRMFLHELNAMQSPGAFKMRKAVEDIFERLNAAKTCLEAVGEQK